MNISEKLNRAIAKGPNTGDDDLDDAILEVLQAALDEARAYEDIGLSEFAFEEMDPGIMSLADAILKEDGR